MRKVINWQEFKQAIGDELMAIIEEEIHAGFQDSVKLINMGNQFGIPIEYEMRTKANMAHDHIKARLRSKINGLKNIETNKWKGIFAVKVGEDAFCRIKKFLKGGKVSGTLTLQQKKFNNQLSILGFPDEPTFITIGYYADMAWTKILSIYASCSTSDGIEWYQKFSGEGYTQGNLFSEIPMPKTPIIPRITPKTDSNEEKSKRVKGKVSLKKNTGTNKDSV